MFYENIPDTNSIRTSFTFQTAEVLMGLFCYLRKKPCSIISIIQSLLLNFNDEILSSSSADLEYNIPFFCLIFISKTILSLLFYQSMHLCIFNSQKIPQGLNFNRLNCFLSFLYFRSIKKFLISMHFISVLRLIQ